MYITTVIIIIIRREFRADAVGMGIAFVSIRIIRATHNKNSGLL